MPSVPPTFEQFTPLKDDVLLALSGAGGAKLLQGQTSADFTSTSYPNAAEGVFCDTKGRVITDFLALILSAEQILLRVNVSVAPILIAALQKYLPFFKVSLTASNLSAWGGFCSASASNSQARHSEANAETPSTPHVIETDAGFALQRGPGHWEIFATHKEPSQNIVSAYSAWQCAAIARGEARIVAATSGLYLPQDLNYDLRGLVNFKKGCYTGQEIVARLHWRGTPKRRLQLALLADTTSPEPATGIVDLATQQRVGSVVNSAPCSDGTLLAIEATDTALASGCCLVDQSSELRPYPA